jgi:hypothetical protein
LVKHAFQESGISMPDEAREVIFPRGVPVTMNAPDATAAPSDKAARTDSDAGDVSIPAEAGLYSEAKVLEDQAKKARPTGQSRNLLKPDDQGAKSK